jgi:hypothetical protein
MPRRRATLHRCIADQLIKKKKEDIIIKNKLFVLLTSANVQKLRGADVDDQWEGLWEVRARCQTTSPCREYHRATTFYIS